MTRGAAERVKRAAFGFRKFRHYRIRSLLYAGRRGTIGGKLLAEMITGVDSELLRLMQSKDRPNRNLPFQDLGVRINVRARRLIAGREE